jgi:hypothetical protein
MSEYVEALEAAGAAQERCLPPGNRPVRRRLPGAGFLSPLRARSAGPPGGAERGCGWGPKRVRSAPGPSAGGLTWRVART